MHFSLFNVGQFFVCFLRDFHSTSPGRRPLLRGGGGRVTKLHSLRDVTLVSLDTASLNQSAASCKNSQVKGKKKLAFLGFFVTPSIFIVVAFWDRTIAS